MTPDAAADHCAALVKQRHPVRFVSGLFAPVDRRRHLFALYAFDIELARVPEAAAQPMIAAIRYQWWRDALEKLPAEPRGHPVLTALGPAIEAGLTVLDLVRLVDERERGGDPAVAEALVVTLAARLLGAPAGENALAETVGSAIAAGDRALLAEARRLWRAAGRTRKPELPAYLPAAFVDARHPVSALSLHWRTLVMALRNRF